MTESQLVSNGVQRAESGDLGVMVNGDTAQISLPYSTLCPVDLSLSWNCNIQMFEMDGGEEVFM